MTGQTITIVNMETGKQIDAKLTNKLLNNELIYDLRYVSPLHLTAVRMNHEMAFIFDIDLKTLTPLQRSINGKAGVELSPYNTDGIPRIANMRSALGLKEPVAGNLMFEGVGVIRTSRKPFTFSDTGLWAISTATGYKRLVSTDTFDHRFLPQSKKLIRIIWDLATRPHHEHQRPRGRR
jgi:hypothetical protein